MTDITARDQISTDALERWQDALSRPAGQVRLEFGFAFGAKGTYPTITVHTKNDNGRWEKVSPFLMVGKDEGRTVQAVAAIVPDGV